MSDMPQTPPPPRKPQWTVWALTLFVIGLLILIPSGLCTGVFGVAGIYDAVTSGSGSDSAGFFMEALMVGGPFIAVGIGLVMAGLSIRKRG
ncbi:MAG: hypothetical protein ACREHE_01210 [Rhizomicrobium sp.]